MIDPERDTVLVTGAAGAIGTAVRTGLRPGWKHLLLTDLNAVAPASNERFVAADVGDRTALDAMMQGVSALVHLTGAPADHDLETLFAVNVRGLFNVFESARLAGVRRIVFASSNHAFGSYPITEQVTPTMKPRPDGLYGAFKVLGETMLQTYYDRHGIESVSLRIGTFRDSPIDQRSLATWLSPRDCAHLVERSLLHPAPGCLIVNGYSANTRLKTSRSGWDFLGYQPQDDAEQHLDMLRSQGFNVDGPWEWPEHGGAFPRGPERPSGLT